MIDLSGRIVANPPLPNHAGRDVLQLLKLKLRAFRWR